MIPFSDLIADIFDIFIMCFQCEFVEYTLAIMALCIAFQLFRKLTTARAFAA